MNQSTIELRRMCGTGGVDASIARASTVPEASDASFADVLSLVAGADAGHAVEMYDEDDDDEDAEDDEFAEDDEEFEEDEEFEDDEDFLEDDDETVEDDDESDDDSEDDDDDF